MEKYKNYSVLGHMDLIARYDEAGIYPFEKIKLMAEKILKIVIAEGKGIEINTSSHRYGLQDTMPSADILKLYRDLGGKDPDYRQRQPQAGTAWGIHRRDKGAAERYRLSVFLYL